MYLKKSSEHPLSCTWVTTSVLGMYDSARDTVKDEDDQGDALGKIACPNPNQQEVTPMPCSKEEFERKFHKFHNDLMSRWAVKHGVRWQLDPTP